MTHIETQDLSYALAANSVSQVFENLSSSTVDATLDVLADSLACGLGGTRSPGMEAARSAAALWGTQGSTVWGGFGQAPAPIAAMLNASSLGALDFEDTDDAVPLHVCSVVLPALLADIEQSRPDCDGREFLTALAVGIDTTMRIGRAGGPKGTRGWNWGLISASLGAMLAVARVRCWSTDVTVSALGHQLSQLSGALQSIMEGQLGARFLPGFAARDVLMSAALASAGISGPRNVFDGRAGVINLYQDGQFDRASVVSGIEQCSLVELSLIHI